MTTTRHHTSSTARRQPRRPVAPDTSDPYDDPNGLRLGTAALLLGLLSQVPLGSLHPHEEYANDSTAAFHEYAHSQDWVLVHLGQFVGVLLLTVGLVTVATALTRQRGAAGFLGLAAVVTAVASAAVFAVQMAVDGVALKAAVSGGSPPSPAWACSRSA